MGRKHWAIKAKEIRYWKEQIWGLTLNKRPPKPLKRARVVLVRHSSMEPDPDNLCISFKAILDSLVTAKILENDRYSNIGMPTYRWMKAPRGKGKIEIQVMDWID